MIDAVIGVIIAVTATTALLLAVQMSESAFQEAGRSPLSEDETELLINAGYDTPEARLGLEDDLRQLPSKW